MEMTIAERRMTPMLSRDKVTARFRVLSAVLFAS
jgi:hypothetical protein